ncbi:MAG: hypothetical protein RLY97_385 [Pseudomonadota bacterium]|jgi:hypothetical protein
MPDNDTRQINRDSLFVMAKLRLQGNGCEQNVRVRNLSAGGLMAEGNFRPVTGQTLAIDIRNIGWVDGNVAWVQDNRFGIVFHQEIDPKVARGLPASANIESEDRMLRRPLGSTFRHPTDTSQIRNV